MQVAVNKMSGLTLMEQNRIKNQAGYWAKTAQNFGLSPLV